MKNGRARRKEINPKKEAKKVLSAARDHFPSRPLFFGKDNSWKIRIF